MRLNALIYRFSAKRDIHSFRVAVPALTSSYKRRIFDRIEAAIELIHRYDRRRLERAARDMPRIVAGFPDTGDACYDTIDALGILKLQTVARRDITPEQLALCIVHEATHARIERCGIRYEPQRRVRIERACIQAELAFAQRLPADESEWYTRYLSDKLQSPPSDDHSDAAFIHRYADEAFRAGVPAWLVDRARRRALERVAGTQAGETKPSNER